MRPLRRLALATCVALALTAAPATAGISPDSKSVAAIDGSDVYGYTEHTGRYGDLTDSVLWRKSLITGNRVKLATFDTWKDRIEQVQAGGGRVAVQLGSQPDFTHFNTKILSMNRDGSGRRLLASSSDYWGGDSNIPATYCGSVVRLEDASEAGAFVVSRVDATRSTRHCGRKPDIDKWSYVEIAPGGGRRTIFSAAVKLGRHSSFPPLARVEVNGDYAAFVSRKSLRVHLRNLVTGAQTGPFIDSVRLAGAKLDANRISLGPNGMLAIESDVHDETDNDPPRWMDVFSNPLLPSVAVRSSERSDAQFCGSHLVDQIWDYTDQKTADGAPVIEELDPLTLAPIRTIARISDFDLLEGCSEGYLVISHSARGGRKLRAIPIPPR